MDTALVVAGISLVGALGSAVVSARAQSKSAEAQKQSAEVELKLDELRAQRELERRDEERRSEAKQVLDRYRGPLLDAAWQLGNRIDNIRHRGFLDYLTDGSGREHDVKLTTLFRFAQYFGWREFVRSEVQLLRFENENDTRLVSRFLNDVTWIFSTDSYDGRRAMLWVDEQRGIGQLMASDRPGSPAVRGHAAFHRDYDDVFAPWMERFSGELLTTEAARGDRLRLEQWALFGLAKLLDEEGHYGPSQWMTCAEQEIREAAVRESVHRESEARLRQDLADLGLPGDVHH